VSYARARHYGADKRFYYHQQSIEYTNSRLRELTNIDPTVDLHKGSKTKTIEQNIIESGSKLIIMAGGEGFEPSTPNLGGYMVTVKQQFIKDRKKLNAVVRSIEINKATLPINSRFWNRHLYNMWCKGTIGLANYTF